MLIHESIDDEMPTYRDGSILGETRVKFPKSPFLGKYWRLLILRMPLNVIDHHNL